MANSKDNLSKYGKGFIGFDEPSGNTMDTIGGWTGTLNNAPVRVAGWNGKGYAMQFNGINQRVQFDNHIIPNGKKTIRFKFKPMAQATASQVLLSTVGGNSPIGHRIVWHQTGLIYQVYNGSPTAIPVQIAIPPSKVVVGLWHDIMITDDGLLKNDSVKIYLNGTMIDSTVGYDEINISPTFNLSIGGNGDNMLYLNGQLDSIEIYNRVISPIPDKYLVQHSGQYKYHDGTAWKTTTATEANFKQYGMSQLSQITEAQWQELVGAKFLAMWSDFEDKQWANAVLNIEPVTVNELLGDSPEVVYYTDSGTSQIVVETEVEPFSVYDYIGELPSVIAYTETTEDIIVSTATEPFTIYDEFGDSAEVLYYTDDTTATEADLILDANWSPIDELEGDFEVVTWTDEEDGERTLEMTALPVPQFTYDSDGLIPLEELISSVKATDLSIYDNNSMVRLLMSNNNSDWYTWNGSSFVKIANMTNDEIVLNGMTTEIFNGLTPQDLTKWTFKAVSIGVFLYDDIRDRVQSKVSELSIDTQIPSNTSKVEDVNLYILNTTAKINIDLSGLSLTGQVVDDDMTRVQYRVSLNGEPYFPADGNFTALSNPPLNIDITIKSDEIKVGDWNTIEVEFQDYFGTTDTWSAQFIGKYAGIMFSDPEGNYYSTDVGKVLKYLEFGEILTGQVTPYYEVKLKNEYGFDVRDATLTVNTQNFPKGLTVELSNSSRDIGDAELQVGDLANDEEFTFYVRMKSTADTIPNDNSKFDIVVLAIRDV